MKNKFKKSVGKWTSNRDMICWWPTLTWAPQKDPPLHTFPSLPNSSIPINELLTYTFLLSPIVNQLSPTMDPAYVNKSEWHLSFHFITSAECFPQRLPTWVRRSLFTSGSWVKVSLFVVAHVHPPLIIAHPSCRCCSWYPGSHQEGKGQPQVPRL